MAGSLKKSSQQEKARPRVVRLAVCGMIIALGLIAFICFCLRYHAVKKNEHNQMNVDPKLNAKSEAGDIDPENLQRNCPVNVTTLVEDQNLNHHENSKDLNAFDNVIFAECINRTIIVKP